MQLRLRVTNETFKSHCRTREDGHLTVKVDGSTVFNLAPEQSVTINLDEASTIELQQWNPAVPWGAAAIPIEEENQELNEEVDRPE
jgi:hypothetical protein